MNPIQEISKKFSRLVKKRDRIFMSLIKKYDDEIIDLNTEQLKQRGINADGVEIRSYQPYSPATQKFDRSKSPTSQVTLYKEGDFHEGFFVNFGKDWLSIYSDDEKTAKLERKYGKEIFGLTKESKEHLLSLFKDELINQLKAELLK